MSHKIVTDNLDPYLRQELTGPQKALLEDHLAQCIACSDLVAHTSKQLAIEKLISQEQHQLPPQLKVKLNQQIETHRARRRLSWRILIPSGTVLAAAVAIMLASDSGIPPTPVLVSEPAKPTAINPQTITNSVPAGHRAVTIEVDQQSAVEGFAKPGSRVDVLLSQKDSQGKSKVSVLVPSSKVLAVGTQDLMTTTDSAERGTLELTIP